MSEKFESKEYKLSRKAYIAQCTFEYFITILVTDAYLAKMLSHQGISDGMIGIISSFVSLAFLFQLLAIFLAERVKNTKKTVIVFDSVFQVMHISLYIVPFMPFSTSTKTVIIVSLIILGYLCKYAVSSMLFKWANSYVEPSKRARYSANKEMISLITGMVFTFGVGYIIDKYEAIGNIEGGFLFIAIAIFILSIASFVSLMLIKKDTTPEKTEKTSSLKDVMKNTLGNKNFINVIILTVLWDSARYTTIGFMGIYKTKDLMLTVGTVQIINIVGNLFRFFLSKPIGRYSDKTSFTKGFKLALCIAAVGFLVNSFSTPSTVWCVVLFTILNAVSMAGTNQNSMNIVYSYVDSEYFVQATAIKNSIGGICGFLASVGGSKLLEAIQNNGNMVFGLHIYGQQVLSMISFGLVVITILFVKLRMEKQEVLKQ